MAGNTALVCMTVHIQVRGNCWHKLPSYPILGESQSFGWQMLTDNRTHEESSSFHFDLSIFSNITVFATDRWTGNNHYIRVQKIFFLNMILQNSTSEHKCHKKRHPYKHTHSWVLCSQDWIINSARGNCTVVENAIRNPNSPLLFIFSHIRTLSTGNASRFQSGKPNARMH